jgi:hypothetical protein
LKEQNLLQEPFCVFREDGAGADAALFAIDPQTSALSFINAPERSNSNAIRGASPVFAAPPPPILVQMPLSSHANLSS